MGSTQSLFLKLYKKRTEKKILLTDAELEKLKKILISMTDNDATVITYERIKIYLLPFMDVSIIDRLYEAMQWRHMRSSYPRYRLLQTTISPIAFVYVIANILKGDTLQKATIIRFMVGARDLGAVTSLDLYYFVKDLINNHLQNLNKEDLAIEVDINSVEPSKEKFALSLLQDLFDPEKSGNKLPSASTQFADEEIASLLNSSPILLYMIHQVMYPPFPIYQSTWQFLSFLPSFITSDETEMVYTTTMLDIPSLIFLNMHIPKLVNKPHEWMLVFSSLDVDKFTFENLISCCLRYDNTLFIIEDSDLYRFGGFSSDKWFVFPKFRGSLGSFVFSLAPYMSLYKSTGINKNLIYMNDSTHEESPQYVGFGGNIGYLGFCVYPDCVTGVSYPTLTYNSPQLSSTTNFKINKFEVWAIFRASAIRPHGWKTSQSYSHQTKRIGSIADLNKSKSVLRVMSY